MNMSYTKHTWQSGESITAEKLNNIESGVASANDGDIKIVNFTITELNYGESFTATADATYAQIKDWIDNNKVVLGTCVFGTSAISMFTPDNSETEVIQFGISYPLVNASSTAIDKLYFLIIEMHSDKSITVLDDVYGSFS